MNKQLKIHGENANLSPSSMQYWNQWGRSELRSMQGIETIPYHDAYHDDSIPEGEFEPEHRCSSCMYCLGLSWSDFL